MKIIYFHIDSKQASYKYRVAQFIPFWQKTEHTVDYQQVVGLNFFQKWKIANKIKNYDIVILQKKLLSQFLIRNIFKKSNLVFDFDDALFAKESYKQNSHKSVDPGSRTSIKRLNYILLKSKLVFAGSPFLYDYAKKINQNTILLPTSLNSIPFYPNIFDTKIRFGWLGNEFNLFYLKLIDGAVSQIQKKFEDKVEFHLMSSKSDESLSANWIFSKWDRESEKNWLSMINVGLMPLSDDEWSKGKCAFKLIQYSQNAKSLIASNVGANNTVVQDGKTGFLASNENEWFQAFEKYVENPKLITEFGINSYQHFLQNFETERNFKKILKSIEILVQTEERNIN